MRRCWSVGNAVRNTGAVARSRRNCSICALRVGAETTNFMYDSWKSHRSVAPVSSPVRSPRGSRPLLFAHVLERQSSANRNYIEDGMRWIRWHSQLMNSFPCSNAYVRRIQVGTLLGQLLAPLFRSLIFFASEAFGRIY